MSLLPSLVLSTVGYYGVMAWAKRNIPSRGLVMMVRCVLILVLLAWSMADVGAALEAPRASSGAGLKDLQTLLETEQRLLNP